MSEYRATLSVAKRLTTLKVCLEGDHMLPIVNQIRQALAAEFGDKPMTCAFATADFKGTPSVRTMVLRHIEDDGALLFVSDRRTHKDDHIRDRPQCEIMFWLPRTNVQIRVVASAVVLDAENDVGLREHWWDKLDPRGARILSGEKTDTPTATEVPVTFELINAAAMTIRIEDYKQKPIKIDTWKRS
jgi:pyridoxine/pyridoxamine 5'-phosphate oxidase